MSAAPWVASAALFALGLCALVLRRPLIAMLLGVEMAVVAVAVGITTTAAAAGDAEALASVLLVLAVAAAEAVVGLSLILQVHQGGRAPETDSLRGLKG